MRGIPGRGRCRELPSTGGPNARGRARSLELENPADSLDYRYFTLSFTYMLRVTKVLRSHSEACSEY